MSELAVRVEAVSKNFRLPHEKATTLKSSFLRLIRGGRRTIETQHALKSISFEVRRGEFFGVVGRNGSGKSTLLKLLAGIYTPTAGRIDINGKVAPFIELGVGFNGELSGRDNVYLNGALFGFSRREMDAMYADIVAFAELEKFMDQKLKNYSSGMQVRLAFSIATRARADILLVDEVLAVGDAAFQRKCFEYFKELKAKRKTVVFVTHDMNAVREYCDRAILIDNSRLHLIGKPQEVAKEYSLLFINDENLKAGRKKQGGERWGNGAVKITNVKISLVGEKVIVDVETAVRRSVDKVVYGLHILGQDGSEITAMNNQMIQKPDIQRPKPGSKLHFRWQILNIFNDGTYFITLTLVDDAANTLDWFIKAGKFTVKRLERSTTPVLPPVTVTNKII